MQKDIGRIIFKGTGDFYCLDLYRLGKAYLKDFYLISNEVKDNDKNHNMNVEDGMMLVTAFVCLAFSSEIFLKAILKTQGEIVRKHNLKELFDRLNEIYKLKIKKDINVKMLNRSFEELLNDNANAFEKLRYVYDGNIDYNITFLKEFNNSLKVTIEDIMKTVE